MDIFNYKQVSQFQFEGRFIGFVSDGCGKIKYLRLALEERIQESEIREKEVNLTSNDWEKANFSYGESNLILNSFVETRQLQIKLSKESRTSVIRSLQPGDWIQVLGEKKLKRHTNQFKLKAYQVNKIDATFSSCAIRLEEAQKMPQTKILPCKPKAKILVCQKSGCLKRGGQKLCQALEAALCSRGLQDSVAIERTSCLKRCSLAPNMVLMPGKTRLSGMQPEAIAALLENLSSR